MSPKHAVVPESKKSSSERETEGVCVCCVCVCGGRGYVKGTDELT